MSLEIDFEPSVLNAIFEGQETLNADFEGQSIRNVSSSIIKSIADDFSINSDYNSGDYVWHDDTLYVFVFDHNAGEWDEREVEEAVLSEVIENLKKENSDIKNLIKYTDGFGSVYSSVQKMIDNLELAKKSPVYRYIWDYPLIGYQKTNGTWYSNKGINTINSPIKYDDSLIAVIKPEKKDDYLYIYFGHLENDIYIIDEAKAFNGGNNTINFRAYKYLCDDNTLIAFGAAINELPADIYVRSEICELFPIQMISMLHSNTNRYVLEGSVIKYYTDISQGNGDSGSYHVCSPSRKWLYANGLPLDAIFYKYDPSSNSYVVIKAPTCCPTGTKEEMETALGGAMSSNVNYDRWIAIPEDCDRYKVSVYGIQRPASQSRLGMVITESMPYIAVYCDVEHEAIPNYKAGLAIKNANTLTKVKYKSNIIKMMHYEVNSYVAVSGNPINHESFGLPYGNKGLGTDCSYWTFFTATSIVGGIMSITPTNLNCAFGQVCTEFISQILGIPYFEGTEWWIQKYWDKMVPLTSDTILHPGDIIIEQIYYYDIQEALGRIITPSEVIDIANASEMVDQDKVYCYKGSESDYKYNWWYYWNGSAWTPGTRSLYTHAVLIYDKIFDPKTCDFVGVIRAESTNIWNRLSPYRGELTETGNAWVISVPSDINVRPINQTYNYAIDKEKDPLHNAMTMAMPPVCSFIGDMVLIGDASYNLGGAWYRSTGFFRFKTGYTKGKICRRDSWNDSEVLVSEFTLSDLDDYNNTSYSTSESGRIDNYLRSNGDLVKGIYTFYVGSEDNGVITYDPTPCTFLVFTEPSITIDQNCRILSNLQMDDFDELWLRVIPYPKGNLPYANYMNIKVNVRYSNGSWKFVNSDGSLSGTYTLPNDYQFISRVAFRNNRFGTVIKTFCSDYDYEITLAANSEVSND